MFDPSSDSAPAPSAEQSSESPKRRGGPRRKPAKAKRAPGRPRKSARRRVGRPKAARATRSKSAHAKRSTARTPKVKTSKAAFILAQPGNTPAAVIVAKGAKAGLKFSVAYVYTCRANAARRNGSARVSRPRAAGKRASSNPDATLRRLIAELGLSRARAVLNEVVALFGAT